MELIKLIFSSFWTIFGTMILIVVFFEGLAEVIKQIKK